jgi:hypothetical protein
MAFFGVSYRDQTSAARFALLAIISVATANLMKRTTKLGEEAGDQNVNHVLVDEGELHPVAATAHGTNY